MILVLAHDLTHWLRVRYVGRYVGRCVGVSEGVRGKRMSESQNSYDLGD